MTPDQREAYLQRNREYKRMRRDCGAGCTNTKTTPQKINSRTKNIIYTTDDLAKSIKYTVLILLRP
jgi:hypothetical protein